MNDIIDKYVNFIWKYGVPNKTSFFSKMQNYCHSSTHTYYYQNKYQEISLKKKSKLGDLGVCKEHYKN